MDFDDIFTKNEETTFEQCETEVNILIPVPQRHIEPECSK